MSSRKNLDDVTKHVWEGQIKHMNENIAKATQAGEPIAVIKEMERLKQFIVATYKMRFGDTYSEQA